MIQQILRRPLVLILFLYIAVLVLIRIYGVWDEDSCCRNPSGNSAISINGIVTGDPEPRIIPGGNRILWYILLNLDNGDQVKILWHCRAWQQAPVYGERWEILLKHQSERNFNHSFATADENNSKIISAGHGNWLNRICYKGRRDAAELLSRGITRNPAAVSILHSVLLGYRASFSPELRDLFCKTGTLHIFAISGLHVSIIAVLMAVVLRWCGVSRVHWVYFLAPMLIVYTIATGGRASAVRACIMMILIYLGPVLSRKSDVLSSLAFAALLILSFAPGQLFDIGFIFSFAVVTGIVLICPIIEKPLLRLIEPEPMRLQPESRSTVILRCIASKFVTLIAVSVSAWLASTPLTMYFFQRFTPVALLSNILVVPLALLIVATGCLSLLMGSCLSLLAVLLNNLNLVFITALLKIMNMMTLVPFGNVETKQLHPAVVIAWYIVLLFIVFLLKRRFNPNPDAQLTEQ